MGLKLKFTLYVSGMIVLILLTISVFLIRIRTQEIQNELIARDMLEGQLLSPDLSEDLGTYYFYQYETYLSVVKGRLEKYPEIEHIRIYNTEGQIIFESSEIEEGNKDRSQEPVSDPFILNLVKEKRINQDIVKYKDQEVIRIFMPFVDKYGVYRFMVEYYFSLERIQDAVRNVIVTFAILLGFFTTLGIVLTLIFVDRFTRPIEDLTKGVEEIGKGNLDHKVRVKTNDEVGILANAFNDMAVQIRKSKEDLSRYNAQLEKQVEQRTKELEQKVDDLERLQRLTLNRELKMVELKEKLSALEEAAESPKSSKKETPTDKKEPKSPPVEVTVEETIAPEKKLTEMQETKEPVKEVLPQPDTEPKVTQKEAQKPSKKTKKQKKK